MIQHPLPTVPAAPPPQVYSRLVAALADPSAPPGAPPPLAAVPIAGAGAGAALSVILGPTELLKCRLQTTGHYEGPVACLRQIVAEEGTRGLARGLGATLIREVRGRGRRRPARGGGCLLL